MSSRVQGFLSRHGSAAGFVFLLLVFGGLAASHGPDANWDLRNYHLYNPFALLNGKFGYDIAPAQMQTFLAPQLDLIYYFFQRRLNDHAVWLGMILALPHIVGAFLTFRIALQFIPDTTKLRTALALLTAVIGATGAGALPTLGASDSDMLPGSLCLAWLLLMLTATPPPALRHWALSGLLFGLAAGFKLTAASYGLGAVFAVLLGPRATPQQRAAAVAAFGLAAAVGVALIATPWWLTLYAKFDNPLFPYFNNILHSPYFAAVSLSDERFKPTDIGLALFYPFYWAIDRQPRVTELPMRDPRVALALVAAAVTLAHAAIRRRRPPARTAMLVVFFAVSYVAWEAQFSIMRYLAPLEFLSVVMVQAAMQDLGAASARRWAATIAAGLLCLGLTVYPDWGHAARGGPAIDVRLPTLPNDALVVLLDPSPMAYVAAFAPPGIRFVGANNNLLQPGQTNLLQRAAADAINTATGPIWGLEDPRDVPSFADITLHDYHLRRGDGCVPVLSNIDANALRLCPLVRTN